MIAELAVLMWKALGACQELLPVAPYFGATGSYKKQHKICDNWAALSNGLNDLLSQQMLKVEKNRIVLKM